MSLRRTKTAIISGAGSYAVRLSQVNLFLYPLYTKHGGILFIPTPQTVFVGGGGGGYFHVVHPFGRTYQRYIMSFTPQSWLWGAHFNVVLLGILTFVGGILKRLQNCPFKKVLHALSINKPFEVSFRSIKYGVFTNFVQRWGSVWGATHCQSEVGHIDMSKFG